MPLPQTRTDSPFISYPQKAAFGRTLPKNKIYERSGANARLKGLFTQQVERIVWQYKLAPETVNLPAKAGVEEIQIFSIQLKTSELHLDVLRCIDGAIQFPIFFELSFEDRTKVVAAYKRPSLADSSRWVVSDYFSSDWLPSSTARIGMPLALDLSVLYEQLIRGLIPVAARPQESLDDLVARVEHIGIKMCEVEKTATRLAKEPQFNRKVEINSTLRKMKTELEQLSR